MRSSVVVAAAVRRRSGNCSVMGIGKIGTLRSRGPSLKPLFVQMMCHYARGGPSYSSTRKPPSRSPRVGPPWPPNQPSSYAAAHTTKCNGRADRSNSLPTPIRRAVVLPTHCDLGPSIHRGERISQEGHPTCTSVETNRRRITVSRPILPGAGYANVAVARWTRLAAARTTATATSTGGAATRGTCR